MHATPLPTNTPSNVGAVHDTGGPPARYVVQSFHVRQEIALQRGAVGSDGSTTGMYIEDLLTIAAYQLRCYQSGDYACEENARALSGIRQALDALGERVAGRLMRGVLGADGRDGSDDA